MRTRMTLSCSARMWRSNCTRALRSSSAGRPSSERGQLTADRLRDHQLADRIQQLVDLLDADANRPALARAARERLGDGGLASCWTADWPQRSRVAGCTARRP